jgi:tRNA/rRNA methyltransferase
MIQIRIVLVRPRNPNNIGAAARAMKNFGFTDLTVVAPQSSIWEEARSAAGAEDILERALVFDTLAEAVSDCTLVIGTADLRRGQGVGPSSLREQLIPSTGSAALVFGSEKTGLTNLDLTFCHQVLTIPTCLDFPSMNLGQAVAVCCYELVRGETASPALQRSGDDATIGELEGLLGQTVEILKGVGFLSERNLHSMTEEFRRSLLRLRPTSREVTLWRGALHQIAWKLGSGG